MPVKETFPFPVGTRQPLWPEGAPLLDAGHDPGEAPSIIPLPVESNEPVGAVVVCPGGGYAGRAPHEADPVAQWLNAAGIAGFVCHYRVAPYRHPVPLMDASRAVRWVRHYAEGFGVKPDRIGILGFSAGGHLASTVGTHFDAGDPAATDPIDRKSCRPDAAILCYPVITFEPPFRHEGSMQNLLGPAPPDDLRLSLSNELQVTADTPPTFLWHTADDAGVHVENSLRFASALSAGGVPYELHVYPHGAHGLGLAPDDPHIGSWTRLCAEWLHSLGF
jgi:acetyl esterase/lipase